MRKMLKHVLSVHGTGTSMSRQWALTGLVLLSIFEFLERKMYSVKLELSLGVYDVVGKKP